MNVGIIQVKLLCKNYRNTNHKQQCLPNLLQLHIKGQSRFFGPFAGVFLSGQQP